MPLQRNRFFERNKKIALYVIKGGSLKSVAAVNGISVQRCSQITYDMLYRANVHVMAEVYREFSPKEIEATALKIGTLKG